MNREKQNKVRSGAASSKQKSGKRKNKRNLISGELSLKVRPQSQHRHRARKAGNRIIMYDPSSRDKERFKEQCEEYAPKRPLEGAICVCMVFNMPRPKSHYRSGRYSHLLKNDALPYPIVKPDLDNIIKFYLDSMTGLFWKDDAYVCSIEASKCYKNEGSVEIEYWNYPE